ncbi:MAG: Ger(x)C family spore germination protein [bacterium]|jgi:spore germination protein KC
MVRAITYLLLLTLLLTLGGCYDKQDLERRTAILAVGIDKNPEDEEGIEVTVQIAHNHNLVTSTEGGGGGQRKPYLVATLRGDSLSSIFQKLENMVNNPLFFGNTMLLAISKEAAEGGIYNYLDFFLRNAQFRRKSWLIITPDRAKELLEITTPLHPIPALYLRTALENFVNTKAAPFTMFANFVTSLNCPAEEPIAIMLSPAGNKVELKGLAAFANDRMVGELDAAELSLFLYLTRPNRRGLVYLLNPENNQMELCYEIQNSNLHLDATLEEGQVSFTFRLWVEGNIVENYLGAILDDEATLRHLERRLAAKLERECLRVIGKVQQEIGSDIFNLGEYIRAHYPHYWKEIDWEKEFPQVPITVEVTTHIRRLGIRRK